MLSMPAGACVSTPAGLFTTRQGPSSYNTSSRDSDCSAELFTMSHILLATFLPTRAPNPIRPAAVTLRKTLAPVAIVLRASYNTGPGRVIETIELNTEK
jgi:hypothetical protein